MNPVVVFPVGKSGQNNPQRKERFSGRNERYIFRLYLN